MLLGIMHAALLLLQSPLISSYQQQKHLAQKKRSRLHKMISSYFTVGGWRMYLSISPCCPCIHTHT